LVSLIFGPNTVEFISLGIIEVTVYRMQFHPAPVSRRSSQLHKMYQSLCTTKNSWWWGKRLLETCRVVIPIKQELSASVGLIHKASVLCYPVTSLYK